MAKKFKVLFLDDELFIHSLLDCVLEGKEYPFEIEKFFSGFQAIEAFKVKKFDCVITDFNMPGMNGKAFIQAMTGLGKKLPPILGYTSENNPRMAFGEGSPPDKIFSKDRLKNCLEFVEKKCCAS